MRWLQSVGSDGEICRVLFVVNRSRRVAGASAAALPTVSWPDGVACHTTGNGDNAALRGAQSSPSSLLCEFRVLSRWHTDQKPARTDLCVSYTVFMTPGTNGKKLLRTTMCEHVWSHHVWLALLLCGQNWRFSTGHHEAYVDLDLDHMHFNVQHFPATLCVSTLWTIKKVAVHL